MTDKRTELETLGEFGLIDLLTAHIKLHQPSTLKGVGDDAAVINHLNQRTVVSTDLLLEGVHFDLSYFPLKHLGYKAIVVNLSDIYAMNAKPTQVTVSLGLSSKFSLEAVEELYSGMLLACERYEVDLVGGDTSSSKQGLVISVTALGEAAEDELVYRRGAKVNDLLCVSGDLGDAYMGFQLLEREKRVFLSNPEIQPELVENDVAVIATGRSDYANQINNVLAFPGIFRGALDARVHKITTQMNLGAAQAIASLVSSSDLAPDFIIPSVFDPRVSHAVAAAVHAVARQQGIANA
jgi:hydrogenase maturation factor